MASVFKRNEVWVVKWRNAAGRWHQERTRCATKAEARAYARQLEHRADLQRSGLTPLDGPASITFGELLAWYDQHHAHLVKSPSRRLTAGKNLAQLNSLPLVDVTTARLEAVLNEKAKTLKPETRIMSFLRSTMRRKPSGSLTATSPVWSQPAASASLFWSARSR